jgi:hypothetical protein
MATPGDSPGTFPDRADDREERPAELHLVADPHAELGEQRRLEDGDGAARPQAAGAPGRIGLERPVEGKAALDGVDLDKPEAVRLRERHHRGEHLLAGDSPPSAPGSP